MVRPLPQVEVRYAGAWHTVTEDVYSAEELTTSKGRKDWAAVADPAEMAVPFIQHESKYATAAGGGRMIGRYSPRNPMSDLYGLIGRNTPVRLRLGAARPRLRLPGTTRAAATTPDTASLRLTGDQRVEILVKPRSWRPSGGAGLARRYHIVGNQRAWAVWINSAGTISWRPSPDGSIFTTRVSAAAVPDDGAERWIAVWHDVNNGAGGNTVGFETSSDGITWDALGTNQVLAGTFAFHPAQAALEVGRTHDPIASAGVNVTPLDGEIGAFRYRSGILSSSTIVSSVDFRNLDTDARTTTDNAGRTWTLQAGAYISDSSIRFAGEAAAWPQEWTSAAAGPRVSVATIAGALRRAQKTVSPLQSSLRRDFSSKPNVVRYYPLEERTGATRFGAGLADDTSFLTPSDTAEVKAGANGDMFVASDPLPTFGAGEIVGNLPAYAPNVSQRLVWLVGVPSAGLSTDRHLLRVYTSGTAARWEVIYGAGDNLILRCYSDTGALIFDNDPLAGDLNGKPQMMSLWLEQQGANLFYQLAWFPLGGVALISDEDTLTGRTYGRITRVQLGTTANLEGTVMGHVALLNGDVHNIWDSVGSSLIAWAGETGTDRLLRLGADEGFPVRITGAGDTPAMGPQRSKTFVELAREIPATDLGMFGDAGDDAGSLAYRPARSIMGREPVLTIPYPLLVPPPLPVDDDQSTVNRVTVKSANGLEFTAEDTTSSMSTLPPPAGVGLYDQSVDINADTVAGAEANSWWRLALGTVEGSRWPDLELVLDKPELEPYVDAILAVQLGDIIRITDLPAGVPPGPVDLLVNAIGDKITRAIHRVMFTCEPASIWGDTGVWAADTGPWPADVARWDSSDTARGASAITSTQTGITLLYGSIAWTTDAAHFPFDIMGGGERMTVTAIGAPGSGSQLFTVVRSVNGIVKGHPAGTPFSLADPTYWAL